MARGLAFLKKILRIVLPFGRRRLMIVLGSMLIQALLQLVGVASVLPFLSVAAHPENFAQTKFGTWVVSALQITDLRVLIYIMGTITILSLFLSNASTIWTSVLVAKYVGRVGHWLRMQLLYKYYSQPYAYFVSRNSAVLTKKANHDAMMFTVFLLAPLGELLTRLCTTVVIIVGLIALEPVGTLAAGTFFASFYLIFMRITRRQVWAINEITKQSTQALSRLVQQFISGMRDIKLRDAGPYFIGKIEQVSSRWVSAQVSSSWIGQLPRNLIEPVAFAGTIIWAMVALSVGTLEAVLPTLGVMAMAGYRLLPNVQSLYISLHLVTTNRFAMEELNEELDFTSPAYPVRIPSKAELGPPQTDPSPLFTRAIEFRDITFNYAGVERPTLAGINLTIERGHSIGFVGQTGSGKSTLINVLLGLYEPTGGEILVDGKPLSQPAPAKWHTRIGYVPQEIFLMDESLLRNIALGIPKDEIDHERLKKAIASAQLQEVIDKMAEGLETQVGERGVMLSGGQRQRVGLARALYFDPEMLILDEGTSALDNETEAKFMQAVESLQGEITVISIAHRLTTVRNCNTIYVLVNGKVSEAGSYDELMESKSEFFRLAQASLST
ncbi:MAG TPA: ABC transporter ATP-binding protein [Terrimicrobiaceae bacterium]